MLKLLIIFAGFSNNRVNNSAFNPKLQNATICETFLKFVKKAAPLRDGFHGTLHRLSPFKFMNLSRFLLRDRFHE